MKTASEQAIQAIAEAGDNEQNQCPEVVAIHHVNDDERHEDHSQEGQLIGSSKDLRELHPRSFEPGVGDNPAGLPAASAAAGSSPVLFRKRCERDGNVPSGKSSSMRSIRCMGKNTTAGVKGSPSRTITVKSSKEASSAPLKLKPSEASARIIPQNFSRGFDRVTITIAPGAKGRRGSAFAAGMTRPKFLPISKI